MSEEKDSAKKDQAIPQSNKTLDRAYACTCGKRYLSYPALFTHIKQKHGGKAPGVLVRPNALRKRGRPRKAQSPPSYGVQRREQRGELQPSKHSSSSLLLTALASKISTLLKGHRERKIKQKNEESLKWIDDAFSKHVTSADGVLARMMESHNNESSLGWKNFKAGMEFIQTPIWAATRQFRKWAWKVLSRLEIAQVEMWLVTLLEYTVEVWGKEAGERKAHELTEIFNPFLVERLPTRLKEELLAESAMTDFKTACSLTEAFNEWLEVHRLTPYCIRSHLL